MSGVINSAPFDHQKETLIFSPRGIAQCPHCQLRHLHKSRIRSFLLPSIDLIRNIVIRKQPQQRKSETQPATSQVIEISPRVQIAPPLTLRQRHQVLIIPSTTPLSPIRKKMTPPRPQYQIHVPTQRMPLSQQLLRNQILLIPHIHMARKTCRRRVRNPRRHHQPRHIPRRLRRLHHARARHPIRRYANRPVIALPPTTERRRPRRRICDQATGTPRPALAHDVPI